MRVNLLCPKLGLPGRFHMAFVSTLPLSVNWSVLLLELIYGSEVQYSWDRKSTWDKRACQRWWVCQRVYPKCGRRALRMLNMVITWHGTAGGEPSPYVFKRKTIWSNVSAVDLCADLKASTRADPPLMIAGFSEQTFNNLSYNSSLSRTQNRCTVRWQMEQLYCKHTVYSLPLSLWLFLYGFSFSHTLPLFIFLIPSHPVKVFV